jgi:CRISPR-associated protein Cmr5
MMMAQLSQQQTIEQQRAAKAWELVNRVKQKAPKDQKDYDSWVKKVPVLIFTNGLGQTAAFLKSKKDEEKQLLYAHLSEWLTSQVAWSPQAQQRADLIDRLIHESSQNYRRATVEALAFLNWLKRFADALLERGE